MAKNVRISDLKRALKEHERWLSKYKDLIGADLTNAALAFENQIRTKIEEIRNKKPKKPKIPKPITKKVSVGSIDIGAIDDLDEDLYLDFNESTGDIVEVETGAVIEVGNVDLFLSNLLQWGADNHTPLKIVMKNYYYRFVERWKEVLNNDFESLTIGQLSALFVQKGLFKLVVFDPKNELHILELKKKTQLVRRYIDSQTNESEKF